MPVPSLRILLRECPRDTRVSRASVRSKGVEQIVAEGRSFESNGETVPILVPLVHRSPKRVPAGLSEALDFYELGELK